MLRNMMMPRGFGDIRHARLHAGSLPTMLAARMQSPAAHDPSLFAERACRPFRWAVFSFGVLLLTGWMQTSSAAAPGTSSLTPGAAIDAGQWRVKPLRARISTEHPLRRASTRNSYLLVDVEFTNLMQRSSRDFAFVVTLDQPELARLGEPSIVLVRDMALPDRLHPRMPETLMLVWQLPTDVTLPPELHLSILGKTFKAADNLVGSPGWFNPAPVAHVALSLSAP